MNQSCTADAAIVDAQTVEGDQVRREQPVRRRMFIIRGALIAVLAWVIGAWVWYWVPL